MEHFSYKGCCAICALRQSKEQLVWAVGKQFWFTSNINSCITKEIKNKAILSSIQYCNYAFICTHVAI